MACNCLIRLLCQSKYLQEKPWNKWPRPQNQYPSTAAINRVPWCTSHSTTIASSRKGGGCICEVQWLQSDYGSMVCWVSSCGVLVFAEFHMACEPSGWRKLGPVPWRLGWVCLDWILSWLGIVSIIIGASDWGICGCICNLFSGGELSGQR